MHTLEPAVSDHPGLIISLRRGASSHTQRISPFDLDEDELEREIGAGELPKENVRELIDRSAIDPADAPDSIVPDRAALEATIAGLDREVRVVGPGRR